MKPRLTIENPILNSPFREPERHFHINDDGVTDERVPGRRPSSFLIPIPPPKKAKKKVVTDLLPSFDPGPREERKLAEHINELRARVKIWRDAGYNTPLPPRTRLLLDHWFGPGRDPQRRLFFAQQEAIDTLIFLHEVAYATAFAGTSERKLLEGVLRASRLENDDLQRLAVRMATGTGKTNVMALIIAWMTLNHIDNPHGRYSLNFLVVAPGITIRDRLQVLRPEHSNNAYDAFDLVPQDLRADLRQARVEVTNFHALRQRMHTEVSKVARSILLDEGEASPFEETLAQMVARVCRPFEAKGKVVVLNDEAHHCYLPRTVADKEPEAELSGDDKKDAKRENEKASLWFKGLKALADHRGVQAIYDLSATPQFLRGSGHAEGTLFPWVVSDFSLVEAIESGLVKVPAVPVDDDKVSSEGPADRMLWEQTRDWWKTHDLYDKSTREPQVPEQVELALRRLYDQYGKAHAIWREAVRTASGFIAPPVFIVVCQNTKHSKVLFDLIAGYRKGEQWIPGKLPLFSNVDEEGAPCARPNTILVDSEQLESGEAVSKDFLDAAKTEIEVFKREFRRMKGAAAAEKITEADLLREVLNTVGRKGKLGEQVRCVVSVSMLTEGWDANTVSHIFGLRAFSSQLLCEQVVGRGLRRKDFTLDTEEHFSPEKVDVYGIPFQFVPCAPIEDKAPKPPAEWFEIKNVPDRVKAKPSLRIRFPRVVGYRHRMPTEQVRASFTEDCRLVLSTEDFATLTDVSTLVGDAGRHELDELKHRRVQEVTFHVAKHVLEQYFTVLTPGEPPVSKVWLFPQILDVTRAWMETCLLPFMKDGTFPGMLIVSGYGKRAADCVHRAIGRAHAEETGRRELVPLLGSPEEGSTDTVDFETTRPRFPTRPDKSPVDHVVADTDAWEQKVAQSLEDMTEVIAYVKNDHLDFTIPYTHDGVERRYVPDFVVKYDDGRGEGDPLHLIIEVTGQKRADKIVKVATARDAWVPAVNHHGGFGRWAFVEVRDVANTQTQIREGLRGVPPSLGPLFTAPPSPPLNPT